MPWFIRPCVVCALIVSGPLPVTAGERVPVGTRTRFQLRKLVDTSIPIPGGTGGFTSFGNPALSQGVVSFVGLVNNARVGVYAIDVGGALRRVADTSTSIPDTAGTPFATFFADPVSADGDIVFYGTSVNRTVQGIYRDRNGTLETLIDTQHIAPVDGRSFVTFFEFAYDDNVLAVCGSSGDFFQGVYRVDALQQSVTAVATEETRVPGTDDSFNDFGFSNSEGGTAVVGGEVAFIGTSSSPTSLPQTGVYLSDRGNLITVANHSTRIPQSTETFATFRGLAATPNQLSFFSFDQGAFRRLPNGRLEPIVTTQTEIPGFGRTRFNSFGNLSVFGANQTALPGGTFDSALFLFLDRSGSVFADIGSGLELVVQGDTFLGYDFLGLASGSLLQFGGDVIDEKRVTFATIGSSALENGSLVLRLGFSDGSQAIYLAEVSAN